VVLIVSSMAVFRGLWTSQDPYAQGFYDITTAQDSPGDGHPFGVSVQGGDLYAQIIYGARPSITIAVFTTIGVTALGMLVGTLAGYYGGKVDAVLSRITDFVLGLPFLLGAIIFLSVFANRTVWVLIIVLTALGWTEMTRVMRGSVIQTKSYDFVEAARALGAKNRLIIWRHIVPNSITPVIVLATLAVGGIVSAEATLTFLGIGLPPGTVSWGGLISEAQTPAMNGNPHLLIFPCAFLVVTVLSFILLGDALRDALDPKIR
jgi:ABC-type dipeptide/oligopeptide/nickel transport system permease subunit